MNLQLNRFIDVPKEQSEHETELLRDQFYQLARTILDLPELRLPSRLFEVFYNQRRRHSTLGQIIPAALERRAAAA